MFAFKMGLNGLRDLSVKSAYGAMNRMLLRFQYQQSNNNLYGHSSVDFCVQVHLNAP